MKLIRIFALCALAAALAGCKTSYRWTSTAPADRRTVAVPTFRNESNLTEFGSIATREVLRELERTGTFRIARRDDAALEIQGTVEAVQTGTVAGDRTIMMRNRTNRATAVVSVSVVDRVDGRVLVDNVKYRAEATFASGGDLLTAERDAMGRLGEDLARQVVDDLEGYNW